MDAFRWSRRITALSLGVLLAITGYGLSLHKPLWNDELFTEKNSIEGLSVREILTAQLNEGTQAPLFYLAQKGVVSIAGYRLTDRYNGEWMLADRRGQTVLRLLPNAVMTAMGVMVFWVVSGALKSVWAGIGAVLFIFSQVMAWLYWVEARPYSLFYAFQGLQGLCLWLGLQSPSRQAWVRGMAVCHWALALTSPVAVFPIAVGTGVLLKIRGRRLKEIMGGCAGPLVVAVLYYAVSPRFAIWATDKMALWQTAVGWDEMAAVGLWGVWAILVERKSSGQRAPGRGPAARLAAVALGVWIMGAALLAALPSRPPEQGLGFSASERYLIFLAPYGAWASWAAAQAVFQALKGRRAETVLAVGIVLFWLLYRFLHVFRVLLERGYGS